MYSYLLFLLILVPFLALSAYATARVNTTFARYDRVPVRSGFTGYDAAVRLMHNRGVTRIAVNRIRGTLTDHFDPSKNTVNLSESTFGSASVAAVAVAAHEIGHVMQREKGYLPYKVRNFLVPIANIGSRIALPLILFGVLFDVFWYATPLDLGKWAMYAGIAAYSLSTIFMLATLPVEFNASRRAAKMLAEDGILTPEEVESGKKVLSAAALTYVASLLISLIYFLRILFLFLPAARRR